jgi:cobaltochelatase CobN
LPGSGHTRPDHPVFQWVMPLLREDQRQPLQTMLDKARVQSRPTTSAPSTVAEVSADAAASQTRKASEVKAAEVRRRWNWGWLLLVATALALFVAGFLRSRFETASLPEGAR